jgi:hypothetical protein
MEPQLMILSGNNNTSFSNRFYPFYGMPVNLSGEDCEMLGDFLGLYSDEVQPFFNDHPEYYGFLPALLATLAPVFSFGGSLLGFLGAKSKSDAERQKQAEETMRAAQLQKTLLIGGGILGGTIVLLLIFKMVRG